MKKTKFILFYSILLSLFAATSCERDFEEVNTNPNNPEEVNPDLLMVNIIRGTVNSMVNDAFSTGNIVAQYTAEIREPGTDRYIWNGSFGTWNASYNTLRDVNNLYTIAEERSLNNYKGIALVMRALLFSRLTDAYGDLPYGEALRGKSDRLYFPAYDTQQNIYAGLLEELKEANALLTPDGGTVRNDILFEGNINKWKKLANSLSLRLLIRQSDRVDPSAAMNEILSNPGQYPVFENNADNAVLKYTQSPNLFPITGQRSGFFLDRRLSKQLADILNATGDPRLPVFAQPTAESRNALAAGNGPLQWVGVRNGETDANLGSSIDTKVSPLGNIYYQGQQVSVPAQGIVMQYAELQFILAESAEKGWISGNAENYYLNGIQASIDYYKNVSGTAISTGASFLSQPTIAYTGNQEEKLEKIATQKWIALFFTDLQGWFEWRRTGYPELTPSIVNNNNNQIPVRFRYPTDQQVTNESNYRIAVERQGPDDINTRVWWDVD